VHLQLLAPEIRKERNAILQCIRHIVKNNFFSIEGPNNRTTLEKNLVDEQNISECLLTPIVPYTEEQANDTIISEEQEDGEVPSDPETQCMAKVLL